VVIGVMAKVAAGVFVRVTIKTAVKIVVRTD
jgi:hypothetical protein